MSAEAVQRHRPADVAPSVATTTGAAQPPLGDRSVTRRSFLGLGAAAVGALALDACARPGKDPRKPGAAGGGGGNSGEPLGTPSATASPEASKTPEAKHTFAYGEGVSGADKTLIEETLGLGSKWLSAKTKEDLGSVSVFAGNAAYLKQHFPQWNGVFASYTAFVGENNDFYINTESKGWNEAPPLSLPVEVGKKHIVIHEMTHVLQKKLAGYMPSGTGWPFEGGADYMAALGLQENDIYEFAKIRAKHVAAAARVKNSLNENQLTNNIEIGSTVERYSLAFLATEKLAKDHGGVAALTNFWKQFDELDVRDAADAFSKAFGLEIEGFYKEFNEYRANGFNAAA